MGELNKEIMVYLHNGIPYNHLKNTKVGMYD